MAQQGQAQQAPYAIERGDTVELGRVYVLHSNGRELIYHGDVNRMTRKLKATIQRHARAEIARGAGVEINEMGDDALADAFDRTPYCRRDDYSYSVATCTKLATGTARKTHDYSYSQGGGVVDLDTVTIVEVRAGQIVEPTDDATANRYGQSFPAMTGDVVTQGHANHCARYGHAAWTADGQDVGTCPRCGEVTLKAGEIRNTADAPGEGDVVRESSRPATEDERDEIDAVGANGLWSLEKGDSSHGDLFVAISFGDGSMDAVTYGFEENGYGQRVYYVFADDSAAAAWFHGIETGPALAELDAVEADEGDERVMVSDQDYDAFRSGYAAAMLWANTVVNGETEDVAYQYQGPGRWWEDAPVELDDANAFLRENLDKLQSVGDADMSQHGHDFALTRNGHGAGFWDRGYGAVGDELTEAAKAYGEAHVILDDDADDELPVTCGTCGHRYADNTPAGRCPLEADHAAAEDDEL